MFDNLSERLQGTFKKLRGQARITEENITQALRDVRMALIEADVALPVVKEVIETIKNAAIGKGTKANHLTYIGGLYQNRQKRTRPHHGRRKQRAQPRHPAAGGHPHGGSARLGENYIECQTRAQTHQRKEKSRARFR